MIALPLFGAFLEAAGVIIEKKILRNKRMNYKNYTVYGFLAIFLVMLPFIYFVWRIDAGALEFKNVMIFAFVILVSILANLLTFYSLKREDVTEFEPLWLLQPLFIVLLAVIFYPAERNWAVVGLALLASVVLVVSHVKKHHFYFNKYLLAALGASFLFAVELVASKPILEFYSPFTLYFIRCVFIFAITLALFRPDFKGLKNSTGIMILIVSLSWVFYRAIIYYAYQSIGIVYTTILFILSPVLMFIFAVVFLKEKPSVKQAISTAIILACVGSAIFVGR